MTVRIGRRWVPQRTEERGQLGKFRRHAMGNFRCCGTGQPPQPAFRGLQTMFVSAFTVLAPTDFASKFHGQLGQGCVAGCD